MIKVAYGSRGVVYRLHITSFPPFSTVDLGMSQAGETQQDVPIMTVKSADSPFVNPVSSSS